MADTVSYQSEEQEPMEFKAMPVGMFVGIGISLGIVVFAVTDSPIWIGAGIILGAAIEMAFAVSRRDR